MKRDSDKVNLLKLFFLIMALGISLHLISQRVIYQKKAAGFNATLSLPATQTVSLGDTFTVPVTLDTGGGSISGVDVKIKFDPVQLNLTAISPLADQTTSLKTYAPVDSNNNLDSPNVINTANQSGVIEFSAVTADLNSQNTTTAYNGTIILANLTFRVLKEGQTSVAFDFIPNSSTDSNVVSNDTMPADLLTSVTNMTVSTDGGPSSATPTIDPNMVYVKFAVKPAAAENSPDIKVRLSVTDMENALQPTPAPSDTCSQPKTGQYFYKDITMSADGNGVYTPKEGTVFTNNSASFTVAAGGFLPLQDIRPVRDLTFAVKGPKHRNMQMAENFKLAAGLSSGQVFDWTGIPLEPGDLPDPNNNGAQDCTVNSIDISQIVSRIGKTDQDSLNVADVSYDGVVNGNDVSKVVNTLSTKPDDE